MNILQVRKYYHPIEVDNRTSFTYSPLSKTLFKKKNRVGNQFLEKNWKSIASLFSENFLNEEAT